MKILVIAGHGAAAILSHRKTAKNRRVENENRMEYFTRWISRDF